MKTTLENPLLVGMSWLACLGWHVLVGDCAKHKHIHAQVCTRGMVIKKHLPLINETRACISQP